MVATYLADIEQLLDEQSWEAAVREARDLPNIAVALEDAHLRSSSARLRQWCADWVRPLQTDGDSRSNNHDSVCRTLLEGAEPSTESVPAQALRRLRLRRLARTPPSRFSHERAQMHDAEGNQAVTLGATVVDAVRRWYAHRACRDPIVQANLARLAVLR
jgi:hypothetical protein